MTRSRDVADSQDSLAGPVPPVVAGKNFQVNGGFDFWQRGTSFASPTGQYTADRFPATQSAVGATWSVSQTASFMAGSRYALRTQRTSGQTGTQALFLGSALETIDVIQLQGKTVTWSYYIKAGALYSGAGGGLGAQLNTGTGTDQGPFIGHTGEVNLINATNVISTTATRFQHTFTVPSNATSLRWNFAWTPTGTAGATDYYDITNMQIEIGSVATPFSKAGGTIQGELAACQRYYQRYSFDAINIWMGVGHAGSGSTTQFYPMVKLSVPMRTKPSNVEGSGLGWWNGGAAVAVSSVNINNASQDWAMLTANTTGLTANNVYMLAANSITAYLAFTAEL